MVSGLGTIAGARFLLQAPRELSAPLQAIGYGRAGLGLLAQPLPFPPGGRYRLRRNAWR
ncbi:hypothetical protein LAD59_12470 [Klebsiella pneumoniae]|nr:hypothetical protein [Klebsiella pneumoniae]